MVWRRTMVVGPRGERLVRFVAEDPTGVTRIEAVVRASQTLEGSVPDLVTGDDPRVEGSDGPAITMADAGTPLSARQPQDPESFRRTVEGILEAVEHLASAGLVHGRLAPAHVLVDSTGTVRLCGLGSVGPPSPERTPPEDVAALGALLRWLLAASPDATDRLTRLALHRCAERAEQPDVARRPDMSSVAASVRVVLRGASDAGADRSRPEGRGVSGRRVAFPLRFGLATAGLAAAGILVLTLGTGQKSGERHTASRLGGATTSIRPSAAALGPPLAGADPGAAAVPSHAADSERSLVADPACRPDPSRCPAPRVEWRGWLWSAGAPGDLAITVDVDCDGDRDIVTVRPTSGLIAAFLDPDPAERAPRRPDLVGGVTPPVREVRAATGSACPRLQVRSGSLLVRPELRVAPAGNRP